MFLFFLYLKSRRRVGVTHCTQRVCQMSRGICGCNRKIFWTSATNVTKIQLFCVFGQKKLFKIEEETWSHTLYTKSVSNVSGHLPLQSEKFLDFCSTCYKTWIFSPHFDDQKKLFKIEEESWCTQRACQMSRAICWCNQKIFWTSVKNVNKSNKNKNTNKTKQTKQKKNKTKQKQKKQKQNKNWK